MLTPHIIERSSRQMLQQPQIAVETAKTPDNNNPYDMRKYHGEARSEMYSCFQNIVQIATAITASPDICSKEKRKKKWMQKLLGSTHHSFRKIVSYQTINESTNCSQCEETGNGRIPICSLYFSYHIEVFVFDFPITFITLFISTYGVSTTFRSLGIYIKL